MLTLVLLRSICFTWIWYIASFKRESNSYCGYLEEVVPTIGQQIKKVVFIFIVYQLASAVLKTGKEDLAEEEEEEKIKSKQNQD